MAWPQQNKREVTFEQRDEPYLTDEMKQFLQDNYFPRYPTKRAVLMPALHLVQHKYNWIPPQALQEVAEFLEVAPAEAQDTASFYEEYWLKPKGKYLLQVCHSLTCELCGGSDLSRHLQAKLDIAVGETTPDGRFTLVELECLGSCGTAPVVLINEVLLENVTLSGLDAALDALPEDPHDFKDPAIDWEQAAGH